MISIPDNTKLRVAHDFDQKPGTAKVAIPDGNGPLSISASGSRPDGTALFEPTDGTNNEGYIGFGLIGASVGQGVTALRNTIIAGFLGVLPGVEVFLGQDGQATQDVAAVDAPDTAPVPTEGSAGALGAGVYKVAAAFVDDDGNVTSATDPVSVTIAASKKVHIADFEQPLPDGVASINWYFSTAAGSSTLKLVANNSGAAFDINALGTGALPLSSVGLTGSRRIGVGYTAQMIAID